ncbi:hypothetical protein [Streptomyces sp. NPDC051567]|uniref:hypothetical protein n=1 Tax=Streptomyces sp. NPDC051567 TaxID=3365660 RepID=UPI003794FBAB
MNPKPSTPESDGPKTETTLTTRIRINIPGSRPIPPVVVRKPVAAAEPEPPQAPAGGYAPEPVPVPRPTRIEAAPEPAPAAGEGAPPNWFAPRKAAAPEPAPGYAPPPPAPGYAQAPDPGYGGPAPVQDFPAYGAPQADGGPVTQPFPVYDGQGAQAGWPGSVDAQAPARAGAAPVPTPVPRPVVPVADGPAPAPAKQGAAKGKGTKGAKGYTSVKPAKPAKKGRSKLVLLGGVAVTVVAVAYGAGLLLNHSDVPKGTTVLGVDISGSRDEAVTKLQTAFGTRLDAPLQLSVAGKQVELKPEKAGLTLDSQTTVRNAAGSDYNPVTVIGSLLGQQRVAAPVLPVDEEKLQVALRELAASAGSASESTITFDTGKAVAVLGKAGPSLDVEGSTAQVTKAFRDMVATGKPAVVELPVSTKAPTVGQAELDRAMKEFAEPAMSATVTVKAGTKASIPFGSRSLPRILSMQVVDGRLVEKYDLDALKSVYGNTFDGVLITRGTGEKTAVTPQDVAGALGKALRGKTPAERTVVIQSNPS